MGSVFKHLVSIPNRELVGFQLANGRSMKRLAGEIVSIPNRELVGFQLQWQQK